MDKMHKLLSRFTLIPKDSAVSSPIDRMSSLSSSLYIMINARKIIIEISWICFQLVPLKPPSIHRKINAAFSGSSINIDKINDDPELKTVDKATPIRSKLEVAICSRLDVTKISSILMLSAPRKQASGMTNQLHQDEVR